MKIPPQLVGKVFRVEVTGEQNGRPIQPNTLSGLLNSSLQRNIQARKDNNINLFMYALALADKQDQYDKQQVDELVSQLQSPKLRTLPKVTAQ